MESPALTGLRSRSRSKTPSADSHQPQKSNRKTGGRNTPLKSLPVVEERVTPEPPPPRTRAALAADLSSDESPDLIPRSKEKLQNKLNSLYQYEYSRVTTTSHRGNDSLADFRLSPSKTSSPYVHSYNASLHRSHSPAVSACSTDSSFAEQALADISKVTQRDSDQQHLPYKLYKMAGEYWNKYPKTDYTYSVLSRDRVELAPGQVAVPNMSRRSLAQYRLHGDMTSQQEIDQLLQQNYDSSEEEYVKKSANGVGAWSAPRREQRWWVTRVLLAAWAVANTCLTETVEGVRGAFGARRTRYQRHQPGLVSRAAAAAVSPLAWLYTLIRTVVTTTVTTITTTVSGETEADGAVRRRAGGLAAATGANKRRLWPWLLLLLPLAGYASHYTYENYDSLALPDFTNMTLDLADFSAISLPSLQNMSLPFSLPNFTVPEFNVSLPDIDLGLSKMEIGFPEVDLGLPDLPEIPEAYFEYKEAVQSKIVDATDYVKVATQTTVGTIRALWNNVF